MQFTHHAYRQKELATWHTDAAVVRAWVNSGVLALFRLRLKIPYQPVVSAYDTSHSAPAPFPLGAYVASGAVIRLQFITGQRS